MSGHTPGLWQAAVSEPDKARHFDTDEVYAPSGKVCRMTGNTKHSYHDARLIAAAPDLLEALQECADWFADWEPYHGRVPSCLIAARAAIEKATGAKP